MKLKTYIELSDSELADILTIYLDNEEYTLEALKRAVLNYLGTNSCKVTSIDRESLEMLISEMKEYVNSILNFND